MAVAGSKIDKTKEEMDEMDEESDEMDEESDEMDKESDEMDEETDKMDEKTDEMDEKTDEMDEETDEMEEETDEMSKLMCPEELGKQAASMLLDEFKQGGVVDSTHQDLLFTLCALCPNGVSKVRVGKLTRGNRNTIKSIRDFLGVRFVMESDPNSDTILVKCEGGLDIKNLS